jgi:hypothetical protein
MIQSSGGAKPALVTSQINGLSAISFNGSSDFMSVASVPLSTFSVFVVVAGTGAGIIYEHSANSNSNPGSYLYSATGNTSTVRRGATTSGRDIGGGMGPALDGNWHVVAQVYSGTGAGHNIWYDNLLASGSTLAAGNPGSATVTDTVYLGARGGASAWLPGKVAELVFFNRALKQNEVAAMYSYFASIYGLSY